MPYETTEVASGLRQRFWGRVTREEFLQAAAEVHDHPSFAQLRFIIKDFLGVRLSDVTDQTVAQVLRRNIESFHLNPYLRVAIVAADPAVLALARLGSSPEFESFLVQTFPTDEDAYQWACLPGI